MIYTTGQALLLAYNQWNRHIDYGTSAPNDSPISVEVTMRQMEAQNDFTRLMMGVDTQPWFVNTPVFGQTYTTMRGLQPSGTYSISPGMSISSAYGGGLANTNDFKSRRRIGSSVAAVANTHSYIRIAGGDFGSISSTGGSAIGGTSFGVIRWAYEDTLSAGSKTFVGLTAGAALDFSAIEPSAMTNSAVGVVADSGDAAYFPFHRNASGATKEAVSFDGKLLRTVSGINELAWAWCSGEGGLWLQPQIITGRDVNGRNVYPASPDPTQVFYNTNILTDAIFQNLVIEHNNGANATNSKITLLGAFGYKA